MTNDRLRAPASPLRQLAHLLVLGVGIGIGIAAFAAAAFWWRHRPKPWNTTAIVGTVRSVTDTVDDDGSPVSAVFNLSLTNKTATDYRGDPSQPPEVFLRTGKALYRAPDSRLENSIFIPSGETVNVQLEVPAAALLELFVEENIQKRRSASTEGELRSAFNSPGSAIPSAVTGISLFDHAARYEINLRKTW
jgi:hypothetical protein